jgi:hypothetical protein
MSWKEEDTTETSFGAISIQFRIMPKAFFVIAQNSILETMHDYFTEC